MSRDFDNDEFGQYTETMTLDSHRPSVGRPSRGVELRIRRSEHRVDRPVAQMEHKELALSGDLTDADDVLSIWRKIRVLQPLIPGQPTHLARLPVQRIQVAVEADVSRQLLLIEDDRVFRNADRRAEIPQRDLPLP